MANSNAGALNVLSKLIGQPVYLTGTRFFNKKAADTTGFEVFTSLNNRTKAKLQKEGFTKLSLKGLPKHKDLPTEVWRHEKGLKKGHTYYTVDVQLVTNIPLKLKIQNALSVTGARELMFSLKKEYRNILFNIARSMVK